MRRTLLLLAVLFAVVLASIAANQNRNAWILIYKDPGFQGDWGPDRFDPDAPGPVLEGWKYRVPVLVTNSGPELRDFAIRVPYPVFSKSYYEGKIRPDYGDVRATDCLGNVLPYWVEAVPAYYSDNDGYFGNRDFVWVRLPRIPSGETIKFYIFYGNPSAASEETDPDELLLYAYDMCRDTESDGWTCIPNSDGSCHYFASWAYWPPGNRIMVVPRNAVVYLDEDLSLRGVTIEAWFGLGHGSYRFGVLFDKDFETLAQGVSEGKEMAPMWSGVCLNESCSSPSDVRMSRGYLLYEQYSIGGCSDSYTQDCALYITDETAFSSGRLYDTVKLCNCMGIKHLQTSYARFNLMAFSTSEDGSSLSFSKWSAVPLRGVNGSGKVGVASHDSFYLSRFLVFKTIPPSVQIQVGDEEVVQ